MPRRLWSAGADAGAIFRRTLAENRPNPNHKKSIIF